MNRFRQVSHYAWHQSNDIAKAENEDFVIVALTAITGSGCSNFADMMAMTFAQWHEKRLIRPYDDVAKTLSMNNRVRCLNVNISDAILRVGIMSRSRLSSTRMF